MAPYVKVPGRLVPQLVADRSGQAVVTVTSTVPAPTGAATLICLPSGLTVNELTAALPLQAPEASRSMGVRPALEVAAMPNGPSPHAAAGGTPLKVVACGGRATVRMKVWLAAGATPLAAVRVRAYEPAVPIVGVPASVAVPSPLSVSAAREGACLGDAGGGRTGGADGGRPPLAAP